MKSQMLPAVVLFALEMNHCVGIKLKDVTLNPVLQNCTTFQLDTANLLLQIIFLNHKQNMLRGINIIYHKMKEQNMLNNQEFVRYIFRRKAANTANLLLRSTQILKKIIK